MCRPKAGALTDRARRASARTGGARARSRLACISDEALPLWLCVEIHAVAREQKFAGRSPSLSQQDRRAGVALARATVFIRKKSLSWVVAHRIRRSESTGCRAPPGHRWSRSRSLRFTLASGERANTGEPARRLKEREPRGTREGARVGAGFVPHRMSFVPRRERALVAEVYTLSCHRCVAAHRCAARARWSCASRMRRFDRSKAIPAAVCVSSSRASLLRPSCFRALYGFALLAWRRVLLEALRLWERSSRISTRLGAVDSNTCATSMLSFALERALHRTREPRGKIAARS